MDSNPARSSQNASDTRKPESWFEFSIFSTFAFGMRVGGRASRYPIAASP